MQQASLAERSMILFQESIKSKYTRANYSGHLREFSRFSRLDTTKMARIPERRLQRLVEDYLMELKKKSNPNSIPSKFQGIKHFCIMNQISLNWGIIYKMFPQKLKTQTLRAYTTPEIQDMIASEKSLRNIALIHFLASTGARIGVFDHDLSLRHLRKMTRNTQAVLLYAGEIDEYWSFLTPQATRALKKYHDSRKNETFHDDTPIFSTGRGQLGWSGARSAVYRAISRSISRSKQNGRYDVQINHGFRKRFNTILKLNNSVNYNIAEKLMGHRNGLDGVYLTPTIQELFAEFSKVIDRLEI